MTANVPVRETWEALETLVDEGVVRSIGLSSFNGQAIYDIERYARHPISSLQIEHHPYLVQSPLLDLCRDHNIAVTAHSSFGPASYVGSAMKAGKLSQEVEPLMSHKVVLEAADKHGKTAAQVLLRWATQRGVAVIPKSVNEDRMRQNLDAMAFDLTDGEVDSISSLDRNLRFNDPYMETGHKDLRIFA